MSTILSAIVWETSDFEKSHLLILLVLADAANDEGLTWPSIEDLRRKSRLKLKKSVLRILKDLEGANAIKTFEGAGPKGRDVYQLFPLMARTDASGLFSLWLDPVLKEYKDTNVIVRTVDKLITPEIPERNKPNADVDKLLVSVDKPGEQQEKADTVDKGVGKTDGEPGGGVDKYPGSRTPEGGSTSRLRGVRC